MRAEPVGGARRLRGGSFPVPRAPGRFSEGLCAPSLLAERGASSAGEDPCPCLEGLRAPSLRTERGASATLPSLPSLPLPRLAVRGCPPGVGPVGSRLLAGSRGTAVRDTTLPFPMPTQAAPRVPLPCLRTRALGWSVLRWWGSPSYVIPWCPSLLAAPLGSPLAGSGRLGLG